MDNNEIKKANRKALPKFMLIMVISLLVGRIGFCAARYGLNTLAGGMKSAGAFSNLYCPLADVGGSSYRADGLRSDL